MTRILGISAYYHDSAACLLENGVPTRMINEERLSRVKHDNGFPEKSIDFCLGDNRHVDFVAFYEKPYLKFERFIISTMELWPHSVGQFVIGMGSYLRERIWIKSIISEKVGIPRENILFIPHHLSHAASAFLCSPFEEADILTIDGVGEWATTCVGHGIGTDITLTKEIRYPHSLGLLYSVFTGYLGFKVNDGEYKLMGLSPYGNPERYRDAVSQIVDVKPDGSFKLNMDYFMYHRSTDISYSTKFLNTFGPPREPGMGHTFHGRHADIAASIQELTEDIILKMVGKNCKNSNLCIAGGVGLNSVANYKIPKDVFVQPNSGDGGSALGAALYVWHVLLENKRNYVMDHAYYGREFKDQEIDGFLREVSATYEKMGRDTIIDETASLLHNGNIVGWFQGRSEWGPRALGSRSILADARREEMQKKVNLSVKFRESFRPFAPSITRESCEEYFECSADSYPTRFMLYVCPVVPGHVYYNTLPAITHVNGTARPQAVFEEYSPRYYKLLKAFEMQSGIPCFLNTSFNLAGEPIVETPQDAWNSFVKSKMDYLAIGNYLVEHP